MWLPDHPQTFWGRDDLPEQGKNLAKGKNVPGPKGGEKSRETPGYLGSSEPHPDLWRRGWKPTLGKSGMSNFPGGSVVKNPPANGGDAGDLVSISGLGRSPGGGNDTPLQYSCLKNPLDRGAWQATVQTVAKSGTPLSH